MRALLPALGLASLLLLTGAASPAETESSTVSDDASWFDDPGAVEESPALIIEAVELIGNEKSVRDVILRRMDVQVGALVDDDALETSRLRLLGSGYFKSVELSLRRGSRRGRVILVVEVEERNTITIDGLYYGGSEVSPFFGGLSMLESNFLGRGVTAGLGFVLGEDRRAFEGHIFIPDLGNTPLQLSASGIYVESGRESLLSTQPGRGHLDYSRIGGAIGLGLGVGSAQRVLLEYRLETIQVDRLPDLPPDVIRPAPSIQFDESFLSSVSLTFERDTRDDSFVPTSGHRVALGIETSTSLIGSSYDFTKYTAEGQLAFQTFEDQALNLRLFAGFIQGRAPFFSQFFFRDHAYFAVGERSLPRVLGVNFSPANDYDDLLVSVGTDYSFLLQRGHDFLYRTYLYAGVELTAAASLDELQEDLDGRGMGDRFPISMDVGLRLDTDIGNFTFSVAYILDLFL